MSLATKNAVTAFEFARGRQLELDRTEAGTGSITAQNRNGLFDPTNNSSPYYDHLKPLVPAAIGLRNPFTDTNHTVFSAYVEDFAFERPLKAPKAEIVTIPIVDGFELLANAKIKPGTVAGHEGGLYYAAQHVDDRIKAAAADAGWPAQRTNIFVGNVNVQEFQYQPGTSMLEIMQDAADAEFPGVANLWMGKLGEIEFRGRGDRFTRAAAGVPEFVLGDAWGMSGDPTRVPIYNYFYRLEKQFIFNSVLVTPNGVAATDVPGQRVEDAVSIAKYGRRDHDILDLLVLSGDGGNTALEECHDFATYFMENHKQPHVHVYSLEIHTAMGEAAWDFAVNVQISSLIEMWTQHPGGGGFNGRQFFVEGISMRSTGPGEETGVEEVAVTLDLSPKERWASFV